MPLAYTKNLSFRFGRASVRPRIDELLPLVASGALRPSRIVSHVLPLAEAPSAYRMFRGREEGVVKVLLTP
jgi:threonine dehydrogenase-like Zn-dependent dehydrogenase